MHCNAASGIQLHTSSMVEENIYKIVWILYELIFRRVSFRVVDVMKLYP